MNKLPSVLVTGGGGFIGNRMVQYLVDEGFRVGVLGRSSRQASSQSIKFYSHDITSPLPTLSESYDAVIHLAGANDVDSRDPKTAVQATTLGTRYVLQKASEMNCKRFIYFSTFQVYGVSSGTISEDTPECPQNDYGITHLFAEEYTAMYGRRTEMTTIRVRPTNIYGCPPSPNHDRWSLVPNCFCLNAIKDGAIVLQSSGRQYRDFVSLDMVAKFTKELLLSDSPPEVINLASGQTMSILAVAELVRLAYERLFNMPCKLEIKSDQPDHVSPLVISCAESAQYFPREGYNVKKSMEREVEKTLLMLKEVN